MSTNDNVLEERVENILFQKNSSRFNELIKKMLSGMNKLQVNEIVSCCKKRIEEINIEKIKNNEKVMIKIGEGHPLYNKLNGAIGIVLEKTELTAKVEFEDDIVLTLPSNQLIPVDNDAVIDFEQKWILTTAEPLKEKETESSKDMGGENEQND